MSPKAYGLRLLSLFTLFSFAIMIPAHAASAPLCPFAWTENLKAGSTGNAVLKLQQFLNADITTAIAVSGAGSQGMETNMYGNLTKQAVIKFQEKYASEILLPNGLTKGTGLVGLSTRTKLNALCAAASSVTENVTPVITGDFLAVKKADEQPLPTLAPSYALYVPFTQVTLTAGAHDVNVSRITIERTGLSVDSDFANADLLGEDGAFIGIAYFNGNHQATFRDGFTVPAGTSKTILIAGDMNDLTDHGGEVAGMKVVSIQADAPVQGALPVTGTFQTMNATLAIGVATATLSPDDPRVDRTRYINDTGIVFSGIRISAGSQEDISLGSITWQQNGTAADADIANIATAINGVSYPTEHDGRFYTSTFPTPFIIHKGDSLNVAVKGDLTTTGSNRTVKFDIDDAGSVYLTGMSYGFGIYMVAEDYTATSGNSIFTTLDGTTDTDAIAPFFSGSEIRISGGAVNGISKT